jgi:F0F1-type ATP synthase membrane subunit b/b'
MNSFAPEELFFTFGSIAVLSLALSAVAVSYVFLLIKLNKSEKDKVVLQSKIRDNAAEILRQSHEKGLRVVQEAVVKAEAIVKDAQIFSDTTRDNFIADLQSAKQAQEKILASRNEEISSLYDQFVLDVRHDTGERFRIVAKDMENHALAGIGEFRGALESERIFMHKQLESKVEEEYKKAQKHIEDYKEDQMKKVEKHVFDILHTLVRDVLGRSLSLSEHEDLVQKALVQMKGEMSGEADYG